MTTESIPKYLFIDENTEQLHDKRIKKYLTYEDDETGKTNTVENFHYINQLSVPQQISSQLAKDTSIYNTEYSSSSGYLFVNTSKGIQYMNINNMDESLRKGKMMDLKIAIKEGGSLFLSPNETYLAVLNEVSLRIYKLANGLSKQFQIQNQHNANNIRWLNQNTLYLWKFENKIHKFEIPQEESQKQKQEKQEKDESSEKIQSIKEIKEMEEVEDIQKCTGASIVGDTIVIFEHMMMHIYNKNQKLNTINLASISHLGQNMLWEFSSIVDIIKLNNVQSKQYQQNDLYALPAIYYTAYEEGDTEDCNKYLYFIKGDLGSDELQARGQELILSYKNNTDMYYNEQKNKKKEFQCVHTHFGKFVTIFMEKTNFINVIDTEEEFQKLGIYSLWPKHEFKLTLQEADYLKSYSVMKNMLPSQRKPIPTDKQSNFICENFEGEFMNLYFEHKETQCTIQFPPSILVMSDQKLYRKYIATTVECCEEDQLTEMEKYMQEIKVSKYLTKIDKEFQIKQEQEMIQNQKQEVKSQKVEEEVKSQKNIDTEVKVQQKKEDEKVEEPKSQNLASSEEKVQGLPIIKEQSLSQSKQSAIIQSQVTSKLDPKVSFEKEKEQEQLQVINSNKKQQSKQQTDKKQQPISSAFSGMKFGQNPFKQNKKKQKQSPSTFPFNLAKPVEKQKTFFSPNTKDQLFVGGKQQDKKNAFTFGKDLESNIQSIQKKPDEIPKTQVSNLWNPQNKSTGSMFQPVQAAKGSENKDKAQKKTLFGFDNNKASNQDPKDQKNAFIDYKPSFLASGNTQDKSESKMNLFNRTKSQQPKTLFSKPTASTFQNPKQIPQFQNPNKKFSSITNTFQPIQTQANLPFNPRKKVIIEVQTNLNQNKESKGQDKSEQVSYQFQQHEINELLEDFEAMRKKVNQKILIYKNDDNLNSELFNIKNAKSIIEECQNLDKVFDLGENGFFSKIDPLLKSIKQQDKLTKNFFNKNEKGLKDIFMKKFNDLDFKTDKMSYYINALEKKESNLFKKSINIEKTSARIMNTLASNLESLEKAVGDRKQELAPQVREIQKRKLKQKSQMKRKGKRFEFHDSSNSSENEQNFEESYQSMRFEREQEIMKINQYAERLSNFSMLTFEVKKQPSSIFQFENLEQIEQFKEQQEQDQDGFTFHQKKKEKKTIFQSKIPPKHKISDSKVIIPPLKQIEQKQSEQLPVSEEFNEKQEKDQFELPAPGMGIRKNSSMGQQITAKFQQNKKTPSKKEQIKLSTNTQKKKDTFGSEGFSGAFFSKIKSQDKQSEKKSDLKISDKGKDKNDSKAISELFGGEKKDKQKTALSSLGMKGSEDKDKEKRDSLPQSFINKTQEKKVEKDLKLPSFAQEPKKEEQKSLFPKKFEQPKKEGQANIFSKKSQEPKKEGLFPKQSQQPKVQKKQNEKLQSTNSFGAKESKTEIQKPPQQKKGFLPNTTQNKNAFQQNQNAQQTSWVNQSSQQQPAYKFGQHDFGNVQNPNQNVFNPNSMKFEGATQMKSFNTFDNQNKGNMFENKPQSNQMGNQPSQNPQNTFNLQNQNAFTQQNQTNTSFAQQPNNAFVQQNPANTSFGQQDSGNVFSQQNNNFMQGQGQQQQQSGSFFNQQQSSGGNNSFNQPQNSGGFGQPNQGGQNPSTFMNQGGSITPPPNISSDLMKPRK